MRATKIITKRKVRQFKRTARNRMVATYFSSLDPLKASTLVVYFFAAIGMAMMHGPNNPEDLGVYMKLMMQGGPVWFWSTCFWLILISRITGLITNYYNRITAFATPVLAMWVWATLFLSNAIAAFAPGAEPSGLFMLYLGPIWIEFFIVSRVICDDHYAEFFRKYYPPEDTA